VISTNYLSNPNMSMPVQPMAQSPTSGVGNSDVNDILGMTNQLTAGMEATGKQNEANQKAKELLEAQKLMQQQYLAALPANQQGASQGSNPTGNASNMSMPTPAPASDSSNPVEWAKSVASNAWREGLQLAAGVGQSVAQVVTGAPAQAGTLPANAVATASPLPTMMNGSPAGGEGGSLIHPLGGKGTNTSGFGMRNHPTKGGKRMHTGQDFGASQGTPIVAAAGGRVVENKNDQNGYGNYVVIEHMSGGQKIETLYGHMKDPSPLQVGASVQQGQQIGLVGSTGSSTGPHLHFEVIVNGKPQDPMAFLPKGDTQKA
jgi:murein DD-endopeptidase MepM/ murein hydrolase activator NlpD